MLSGFSRESDYIHIRLSEDARYFQVRLYPRICLRISTPTPFNVLFRQYAGLSLLRPHFAPYASTGLLTCSSIRCAFRLFLRSRLTLNRLTLFRNPQSSGGRGSHPPYRYLYLHLLFHKLQRRSSRRIRRRWNAPLPILLIYIAIPRLRCLPYTRLLSTPGPSTSELLRTL